MKTYKRAHMCMYRNAHGDAHGSIHVLVCIWKHTSMQVCAHKCTCTWRHIRAHTDTTEMIHKEISMCIYAHRWCYIHLERYASIYREICITYRYRGREREIDLYAEAYTYTYRHTGLESHTKYTQANTSALTHRPTQMHKRSMQSHTHVQNLRCIHRDRDAQGLTPI